MALTQRTFQLTKKIPSVDQWNVTIERQFPSSVNLSVAYVGNLGRHLNGGFNLNSAVPGSGADINLRRPLFGKFGLVDSIFDKCDCTSSNYNALQIRGEKRFGATYSILASFTYSRTMDFGEFGTPTDQYNTRLDYGPADFNRLFVFTLAHTYTLPFGPGRKFSPIPAASFARWWRTGNFQVSRLGRVACHFPLH